MLKNNQKCLRLSNEVLQIVESVKGEGFNDKFERLVFEYERTIPEREKRLAFVESQIKSKLKMLSDIELRINELTSIEYNLKEIQKKISETSKQANKIIDVSQYGPDLRSQDKQTEIQNKKQKCIS